MWIFGCSFLFFFSSRRRHTRSLRDWSSDVCSSDLGWLLVGACGCVLGDGDEGPGDWVVAGPLARFTATPTEVRAWPLSRTPSAAAIGSLIAASMPVTAPIAIAKISTATPTTNADRRHGNPARPPAS